MPAGDADAARAEYDQALALALSVRAEVGSSLPVEVRIALTHLRLASVAQAPGTAREHLAQAANHARASRAPAVVAAIEAAATAAALAVAAR